jgi:hypothetical protein
MRPIAALFCAFLAGAGLPALAQQAVVAKDSDLRSEGSNSAPVVGKVKQGTSGEVTGKNGVFVNLKAPDATGWLFSLNLNFASVDEGTASAAGLGRVRGSTKVQVTSTLGARGFDDEDLQKASFNAEQMQLFEQYGVSKEAASDGARTIGLEAARVDYLGDKSP